jgi:hypothetical protein
MLEAMIIVLAFAAAAVWFAWLYFRRFVVVRPPLGVFNLRDIALMLGFIILGPFLDLALPLWIVGGLLLVGGLSTLYFMWEPVLPPSWARWLATVALVGIDLAAWLWLGKTSPWWHAINNVFVVLCVVGITNLWAQSGMKARDAAILAGALAIYDLVATALLPLMGDLFIRLAKLPLTPLVAWPIGSAGQWAGIGLGDLLLAAAFPLVMRKAFGRSAGLAAMAIGLGAIAALILGPIWGLHVEIFPVMVVLGPLMVLQYAYWRRRRGQERRTWQYLQAEPLRH